MDNSGLEVSLEEGFQSPCLSAVSQELFQQTQSEIESRNHNRGSYVGSTLPEDSGSLVHDETCRYEPLLDSTLSHKRGIVSEDDDLVDRHPCLSANEQANANEVAELLIKYSRVLPLKIEPTSPPISPDDGLISVSEDSCLERTRESSTGAVILSHLDIESLAFASPVSKSPRDCLILDSSRGFQNVHVLEAQAQERQGNEQSMGADKAGSNADFGQRWHVDRAARVLKPRKGTASTWKKSGRKARSSKDGDEEFVDVNALLLQSAEAVGANNRTRALEILNKVRRYASPCGNSAQRLAYHFTEAMDARFCGTGWPLYLGLLHRPPPSAEILKAIAMYVASCPFVKASHFFINQTILNTAINASKLHIMDFQTTGFQYRSLFKALAARPGGPPQVRLTGIGFPQYSMMPARTEAIFEGVQKTGQQLSDYAASCGVPFQYTAWAGTREDLRMQDFVSPERSPDEVLVIISAYFLRYVMDDTLDSTVARSKLLKMGRNINPDVYIQGIVTGSYSSPFFTRRFWEALFHFQSLFDMLDTFIDRENADRLVFESEILGKAILNIVACEGPGVEERIGKYKRWQTVTEDVGFVQLPLDQGIKNKVERMLNTWHKEYMVGEDSQYLLMGWKGRMLHAMSTWRASA